jgi:trans-2,3-dihydro-3-hydroxyanthranilate isomerase
VFSAEKYKGNQLAVVAVRGNALSQAKKQLIAREFGFSETCFLHDAPETGMPRRLDIFTQNEEISFAGHPVG